MLLGVVIVAYADGAVKSLHFMQPFLNPTGKLLAYRKIFARVLVLLLSGGFSGSFTGFFSRVGDGSGSLQWGIGIERVGRR